MNMKNRYLVTIAMLLLFLALLPLWIFQFNYSLKTVIALFLSILLIGLLINVIKKISVPSELIFNNRFRIDGVIFSIFIILVSPIWNRHVVSILTIFGGF